MIQGEIQTLPLTDLIQWLALTRRTGKLALGQEDVQNTLFYFAEGKIVAASNDDHAILESADKICAVLSSALAWRAGRFVYSDGSLPLRVATVKQNMSAEAFLLRAATGLNLHKRSEATSDLGGWDETEGYSETFTLADALRLQVVDLLLKEDFSVPAMPQLAIRVLELTRDENFSLRDLGNLILTDQVVAARILRYANSALHSAEREVDSLAQAVQRLGANEVVNIVLAVTLQTRRLGRDRFAAEKSRLSLHSAVAAFFTRALAARAGLNSNLGFLCGLLMDFGMTVLYSLVQQALSQRGNSEPISKRVIEEIVRDYHPRIGRVVGEKWRLPSPVIETMAYHHCPSEVISDKPYVAVAALADALTTFALGTPRAELEDALAGFQPERLLLHPAAQFLDLSSDSIASAVLKDLPRCLDQALEFVVD
jgi:HD-like signal output (HDOD) protein